MGKCWTVLTTDMQLAQVIGIPCAGDHDHAIAQGTDTLRTL